jgi:HK97 family phage portal protein
MGFWNRLLGREEKSASVNPDQWFINWANGGETLSGERVTPESSLKLAAVWACVRVRSEDVAKLPCILYRRQANGKVRAVSHPLYDLVKDRPNPRMTAFEFRQFMQAELDLRGNALAIKEFNGRGRVVALWPVCWQRVQVLSTPDHRELFYRVTNPQGQVIDTFPQGGVVHLRGQSLDGMVGLSPIGYHRETIGLALAAQKYGSAFFGNSAQPRGALKVPGKIDQAAADVLRESWERNYRGTENSHRVAILDGGFEYSQIGMDNTDAQYIETRVQQNSEIWRMYRMPPHKVGDLSKATFSNIEQQSLEYVTDCLMSELVRWEQVLKRDLLLDSEQDDYFFEFLVDALLRGDFKSRMEGYAIARNWGIFSADDCRDKENMNHLPDNKGQIYLQPLNMVEAGTVPAVPPKPDITVDGAKHLINQLQLLVARAEHTNGHAHA